jgi:predicted ATP-grasp superfamily ATP-dependent carboligase
LRALIVERTADRGSLAACRALHRAGWTVGIGGPTRTGLAAASRCTSRRHPVPPPQDGIEAFVDAVNAAIEKGGYEIVFGGGDAEIMALSLGRGEIASKVPYAPHEVVVRAHDKLELLRAARGVGFSTPETVEATEAELKRWTTPLLVKARLHAPLSRSGGPSRFEAAIAPDRSVAARRISEIRMAGGTPLLQRLVPGRLMAFTTVTDRAARIVAHARQIADLTWPPASGVSVRARTVQSDEGLARRAAVLLEELGWFGLVELQFIAPERGAPRLIDFNGRFYGSLGLSVAAGANLPAIWASVATDRPLPPRPRATPGIRYHWMEGDLRRALVERRQGMMRDLAGCFYYARGAVHSVWAPDDPRPALRALRLLGRRAIQRTARGGRRGLALAKPSQSSR